MRLSKALWNAMRDMFLVLISGLIAAQITIYLINESTFLLLIGTTIIFCVILFFVYLAAKDDIVM